MTQPEAQSEAQPDNLDHLPFGAALKYYRLASSHTQADLARQVGYQVSLISMIEQGQRFVKREVAETFATALGLLAEERITLLAAHARTAATRAARKVLTASHEYEKRRDSSEEGAARLGPLVAREREMERLKNSLQAFQPVRDAKAPFAATPMRHLMLLAGEPGIGKTRLALEALAHAQAAGMLVASGHCYEEHQRIAFAPFVELMEQLRVELPGDIYQTMSARWPLLRLLLPNIRDVSDASDVSEPASPGAAGPDDVMQLHWQVGDFLRAVAAVRPVALFLDDIHWADEASLELIKYLTRRLGETRVLLLGAYRNTEMARRPTLRTVLQVHELEKERLAERVIIPPLTEAQTTDLLNAYLPSDAIAPEISDLMYQRTGGTTFFVVELLRAWQERDDLVLRDSVWTVLDPDKDRLYLPPTVVDMIRERVLRLHPLAQDVLRDASVLGQLFAASTVQRMGERSREEVADALAEAEETGLVRDAGMEGYHFQHALVRHALYTAIPTSHRRRLHHLAAEALLEASARRGQAAKLAWHFREGDDLPQALIYSLQAGIDAETTYAHKDAQEHYRIAESLARDLNDQESEAMALDRLADVNYLLGLFNEAYADLVRATAIYRSLENWERLAWATCQMAKVCDALGKIPESMRFVEALLDTLIVVANARNPGDTISRPGTLEGRAEQAITVLTKRTAARLVLCLEVRLVYLGRYDEVYPLSVATITHARRAGDLRMESLAYSFRGIADAMRGHLDDAATAFQDALRTGEACGDLEAMYLALSNSGAIHQQRAAPRAAYQVLSQTLEIIRRLGDTARTSQVLRGLGDNYFILGEWTEARARYEEAMALGAHSDRPESHRAQLGLLRLDIVEGKRVLSENVSAIEAARTYQSEDIGIRLYASSSLAEVEIVAGFAEAVRGRIQRSLAQFASNDPAICEQLALLAWAELELGHGEDARATLAEARRRADALGSRLMYVTIWRIEALVAVAEGRWEAGAHALDEALALARGMPYPYAEAKALYVYGLLHHTRGSSESARPCFEQALIILARLGERLYAERIERNLAALA